MSLIIGNGITVGQGITITTAAAAKFVGNTQSNFAVTFANTASGYTQTVSSSPFVTGSGKSYNMPALQGSGNVAPTGGIYSWISVAAGADFNFGTGDFTMEWFEYQTSTNNFPRRLWYSNSSGAEVWGFDIEGSAPYWWTPTPTSFSAFTPPTNTWTHYALVRISGSLKLYKNGVLVSSFSMTTNFTSTTYTLYIGGKPGGYVTEQFIGYMTSIRIVNGLGVYAGNFTVPTSPLGQTQSTNPYGGANTAAITTQTVMLVQA